MSRCHLSTSGKVSAALLLSLVAGLGTYGGLHAFGQDADQSPASKQDLKHAFGLSEAFRSVSKALAPSVVNIRSTQRFEALPAGASPFGDSPFDEEFFRRFFGGDLPEGLQIVPPDGGQPQQMPQQPRERVGQGTGVIVRADGYIVTNNHVVDQANEITVRLDDDREYEATVIGADPETDLAVIKIEATGLTPAKLGDSSKLEQGEWVLAMGSPFGLQHTVTAGIVSATGRANMGLATFEDFIQTDAAINPGNSGGPLVSLYGEVVGINTAISTRNGGYMGVGFAIPSDMVKMVLSSIIETGTVKRGALGVGIKNLDEKTAGRFGFEGTDGVIITEVYEDSAAAKAGIKIWDIVTKINGEPTEDMTELLNEVARHAPGDEITLHVFRDGDFKDVTATLGDRSVQFAGRVPAPARPGRPPSAQPKGPADDLGLAVQELTPEIAGQLNAGDREGVVVTKVTPGSSAAEEGLARGDLITRVDDTDIESVEDFNQAMRSGDLKKGIALQVYRGGQAMLMILAQNDE